MKYENLWTYKMNYCSFSEFQRKHFCSEGFNLRNQHLVETPLFTQQIKPFVTLENCTFLKKKRQYLFFNWEEMPSDLYRIKQIIIYTFYSNPCLINPVNPEQLNEIWKSINILLDLIRLLIQFSIDFKGKIFVLKVMSGSTVVPNIK